MIRKIIRRSTLFFLCIILVLPMFLTNSKLVLAATRTGTVNASSLNVRTGAGTDKKILQNSGKNVSLKKGTKVTIISEKKDWFYISFVVNKKTLKGYVLAEYIKEDKAATTTDTSTKTATSTKNLSIPASVTASNLIVRKSASTTAAQLTVDKTKVAIKKNTKVTVIGEKLVKGDKWYQISFKFNKKTTKGYVHSDYIKMTLSTSVKATVNSAKSIKIRTGAGSTKSYLTVDKKTVSLKNKKSVTITKEVTVKSEKWYKVSFTYNGAKKTGYLLANSVLMKEPAKTTSEPKPEEETPVTKTGKVVNANTLRVRTGVGTSKDQLTSATGEKVSLILNQKVTILAEESDGTTVWYKVSFTFGGKTLTGYVSGDYIAVDKTDSVEEKPDGGGSEGEDPATEKPVEEKPVEEKPGDGGETPEEEVDLGTPLTDAEFEAHMTSEGFPDSYKDALRNLHKEYPYWRFEAYNTGLDWNTVIDNQSRVGKNLISNTKNIGWKSIETGAYNWKTDKFIAYDGSTWVTASKSAVEYYMDPRNFLAANTVFQFESLKYKDSYQNTKGVENVLKSTAMSNSSYSFTDEDTGESKSYTYAETFIKAAEYSGVSPYHLAARVKQEVVTGTSTLSTSVTGTVPGYEGYYNFYNIGATHSTVPGGNIANGLNYAKNGSTSASTNELYMIPWNSQYKSIVGGSQFIGSSYINRGQDTIYLQKFNVTPTATYTHQYMANVEAAYSESIKTYSAYSGMTDLPIVFSIPVYNNMPKNPSPVPANQSNPNNWLTSLSVDGYSLTPTFKVEDTTDTTYSLIVPMDTAGITVSAKAVSSKALVQGDGYINLTDGSNTVPITVTAENGDVRQYTIYVVKEN